MKLDVARESGGSNFYLTENLLEMETSGLVITSGRNINESRHSLGGCKNNKPGY